MIFIFGALSLWLSRFQTVLTKRFHRCLINNMSNRHISERPQRTSRIMSSTSSSVGWCPKDLSTVPSSSLSIVPKIGQKLEYMRSINESSTKRSSSFFLNIPCISAFRVSDVFHQDAQNSEFFQPPQQASSDASGERF